MGGYAVLVGLMAVAVLVGFALGTLLRHLLLALLPGMLVCVLLARWFAANETGEMRLGFWGALMYPAILCFPPYLLGVLLGTHAFTSGTERILERERRDLERLRRTTRDRRAGRETRTPTGRPTGS